MNDFVSALVYMENKALKETVKALQESNAKLLLEGLELIDQIKSMRDESVSLPEDVAGLVKVHRSKDDGTLTGGFHRATADTIEAQAAENARLTEENQLMAASLDEEERKHGLSTNGGMWRFWSQQLREYHEKSASRQSDLARLTERDKMLTEAWPRWRCMLLDESPIPGAAIKEIDTALADANKG